MRALGSMVDGGSWCFRLHVFLYDENRLHSDDVEKPFTIHHPPSQLTRTLRGFGLTMLVNVPRVQESRRV